MLFTNRFVHFENKTMTMSFYLRKREFSAISSPKSFLKRKYANIKIRSQ